jgi:hypothetical protein
VRLTVCEENSSFFSANSQRAVGYSREKAVPNPCNSKKNGRAGIDQMNLWKKQLVWVYFWMITRETTEFLA